MILKGPFFHPWLWEGWSILRSVQSPKFPFSTSRRVPGWRKECPRFDFHTPVLKCLKLGAPPKSLEKTVGSIEKNMKIGCTWKVTIEGTQYFHWTIILGGSVT